MKNLLFLVLLLISLFAHAQEDSTGTLNFNHFLGQQKNNNYNLGEYLRYSAKYSFFYLGEAEFKIDTVVYVVNDYPTYKIDIIAKSKLFTRWFAKIDEIIGSYTDTSTFRTIKSYKYVKENDYIRNEVVDYNYKESNVKVFSMSRDEKNFDNGKTFSILPNSFDITTVIMNLRSQNFDSLQEGDIFITNCFFEKTNFFSTLYFQKKETLRTGLGKLRALVFNIAVHKTRFLVDSDEPIHTIWLSDDLNHIPLKIETKTKWGKINIKLTEAKNLKYPLISKL